MTFKQINKKLGQDWFIEPKPIASGRILLYAEDPDVISIDIDRVFKVEETGESRVLYEWLGGGKPPKDLTDAQLNGEDNNVRIHCLSKWQARGSVEIRVKFPKDLKAELKELKKQYLHVCELGNIRPSQKYLK